MTTHIPPLSPKELLILDKALYFMKIAELKKACALLKLPESGAKSILIKRIMTFIKTGTIAKPTTIPLESCANSHPMQSLKPSALMLYGEYKNNSIARAFFKKLIGPHFHFTAFGGDWLEERWLEGNPPTYQEFADYWVEETEKRKTQKATPKKEWAYVSFIQQIQKTNPEIPRSMQTELWKKLRAEQATIAFTLLKRIS